MGQTRSIADQRVDQLNAAEAGRASAASKQVAKPAALQRDPTDLAALSRSKPLAARRTVSNVGSLASGGRGR